MTALLFTIHQIYQTKRKNMPDIHQQKPHMQLQPTNPKYNAIECELDKLKQMRQNAENIELNNESNKSLAPILFEIISNPLTKICNKLGVKIPKIVIYLGNSEDTYNAIADRDIEYWEDSQGESVKILKVENCEFIIGEGIIKLLLWNVDGKQILEGLLAHEMSHLKQDESLQSDQAELDADASAIKLLGQDKAYLLIKAINISTLSAHIFSILTDNAKTLNLSIEEVHKINTILTNSIIQQDYTLGDLGKCASHAIFELAITKVFKFSSKQAFNAKVGISDLNLFQIYERLQQACQDLPNFMEKTQSYFRQRNKYITPNTHPAPAQRYNHIQQCINHL